VIQALAMQNIFNPYIWMSWDWSRRQMHPGFVRQYVCGVVGT
jgi:hypothetical protein